MKPEPVEIRLPFLSYPDKPLLFEDVSLTHQSFAQECDLAAVMAQWERGIQANVNPDVPVYEDVSDLVDYQQALAIVAEARDSFSALPSRVRERFDNNPASLIDFLNNPANTEEARSLGLLSSGGDAKSPSKGSVAAPPEPPKEAS
jgi:phage internal scaffolding protein